MRVSRPAAVIRTLPTSTNLLPSRTFSRVSVANPRLTSPAIVLTQNPCAMSDACEAPFQANAHEQSQRAALFGYCSEAYRRFRCRLPQCQPVSCNSLLFGGGVFFPLQLSNAPRRWMRVGVQLLGNCPLQAVIVSAYWPTSSSTNLANQASRPIRLEMLTLSSSAACHVGCRESCN
jgi:hypothetical protein